MKNQAVKNKVNLSKLNFAHQKLRHLQAQSKLKIAVKVQKSALVKRTKALTLKNKALSENNKVSKVKTLMKYRYVKALAIYRKIFDNGKLAEKLYKLKA